MTTSPAPIPLPDERLALLVRLSQDLNASLDPDEVLRRVMNEVIAITHAERGFVLLVADENAALAEQAVTSFSPEINVHTTHGIDPAVIASKEFHASRGVIERALAEGKPLLTSDAQADDRFNARGSVISMRIRSILCVPLKVKERLLGLIYVDNRIQAGVFSASDLDLLVAIAANAAIAVDNARLYHQAQSRVEVLDTLHKISKEITATLDLDQVLNVSTESVKALLKASAASILTIEEGELIFQVAVGERSSAVKPFRIPKGKGIAWWVIENNQPVIVNDVAADSRFYNQSDAQSGFTTRSLVAVPLMVSENKIGVIEAFNKPGGFSEADLDLLATYASNVAFAIENARLYKVAIEKGRMERELQMARRVQASLLPQQTPALPGWEFAARWLPARQVSGDYYDFVQVETDHERAPTLVVMIADVADKGMPAALFMALARSTLRASAYTAPSPVEAVTHANILVSGDSYNSMFITLLYAQLDPQSGDITYVNAGHNPPLHVSPDPACIAQRLERTGIPLGIDADGIYQQRTLHLEAGEFLVLYTDGIVDAFNAQERTFGTERLQKVLLDHVQGSASEMTEAIERALRSHIGEIAPYDDMTLVIIKRTHNRFTQEKP